MESRPTNIVINGAASQYDRWLRALDPGYAEVDGRSFPQLLNFAVKYGGLINFYNLENEIDGDWTNFFLTDPLMVMASIETMDLTEIEAAFARLKEMTLLERDSAEKFTLLRATFREVLALPLRVNQWLSAIDLSRPSGGTGRLLRGDLIAEIDTVLNAQLRKLKAYDEGAASALGSAIGLDYGEFLPIWDLTGVCPDSSIYKGRRFNRKIDHAVPHLDPIFFSFVSAIGNFKLFAASNLPAAIETGYHKPQIGLYIAFVRLFHSAQQTINTTSSRYVDFYYRDVLREKHRDATPDSVYLNFVLADEEGVLSTTVPRGALFPAGQDRNGADILYAADKALVVTAAQIAQLLTLQVVYGSLLVEEGSPPAVADENEDENEPIPQVVREIFASKIFIAQAQTEAAGSETPWATFGKDVVGTTSAETTELASLGFGVASPYLLLAGGQRTVDLRIRYARAFQETVLDPLLKRIATETGLSESQVFTDLLEQSFTLYISTAAGWLPVKSYCVCLFWPEPSGDPSFRVRFKLPPSAPPMVGFNPESAEEADKEAAALVTDDPIVNTSNPAPQLPTLKAYLRQQPARLSGPAGDASVYPLSVLTGMPITAFDIGVAVAEMADLQLSNTDGVIDTTSPFAVFGGLPVVGSYLSIQQPELFVKTLDCLQIQIAWFNLPQNSDGFKGYYKYYDIGLDGQPDPNLFDNQVFRGAITVTNPGTWVIDDSFSPPDAANVYLFRTEPDCNDQVPARAAPLCTDTGFDTLELAASTPPAYYDPAAGAIKLELTEPPYAFGNSLYSQNVLNAVIRDLPDTERCQAMCLTECDPLKRAMQCIEECIDCLDGCGDSAGLASPPNSCAETCFMNCVASLIKIFVECVKPFAAACGEPFDQATVRRIEALMEAWFELPEDQMAQAIQESLDECLLLCIGSPPHLPKRCDPILDAILCVSRCAADCQQEHDASCLKECLQKCVENLSNAYDACLTVCMEACLSPRKELRYPNEPYLPQATSLTVSYSAHCSVAISQSSASGSMFHLLPFGGYGPVGNNGRTQPTLLPVYPNPGNLYVGFSGLVPPQTLTMLFEMEASNSGELPSVRWDYLTDNTWQPLEPSRILSDWTNGLQNSGIITLSLPFYNPTDHTVLPPANQWIRASVAGSPGQFPGTIAIYPQALTASWVNQSSTGEHLARPLPPHTINGSVEELPYIDTIDQPMESFGGRVRETDDTFEIRVGERLRHKDRAILGWDYERLVLDRFPTIWKVQTLPACDPQGGHRPGSVLVVVVPGSDSIQSLDPTAPTSSSEMLSQIQSYLESLASSFVTLYAVNPVYVRIQVSATVEFVEGEDPGDSIKRLNDDLVQYLSPWYYDAERAAKGGSYASEDNISEFIQTRSYVEAMNSILFSYDPKPELLDWYFLTSAASHRIADDGVLSSRSRSASLPTARI